MGIDITHEITHEKRIENRLKRTRKPSETGFVDSLSGILLINKAEGSTSFSLVRRLRKITQISKIGHAGTLDPLATGVMVMLIGKEFTKKSSHFLAQDKEYEAKLFLGIETDTYDGQGKHLSHSSYQPAISEIYAVIKEFQGEIKQIPPMFSAKKVQGKKLYELARKGITIERAACSVWLNIEFLYYEYPFLNLCIKCSKGTYIRSLAHDIGQILGCGAHLHSLIRTRVGPFSLTHCIEEKKLEETGFAIDKWLHHDDL